MSLFLLLLFLVVVEDKMKVAKTWSLLHCVVFVLPQLHSFLVLIALLLIQGGMEHPVCNAFLQATHPSLPLVRRRKILT